jgi:tetratricopeptide (TPR) repeat protein
VRRLVLLLLLVAYAALFIRLPSMRRHASFDPLDRQGREIEKDIESSRFAAALPIANALWSAHDHSATVAHWRAEIFRGLGRAADEAAAWEDYLRLSHQPDEACPALAVAYGHAGDQGRSLDAYERCAAAAPDDPERWIDLATAYQLAGRHSSASEAFQHAFALDPTDGRIPRDLDRADDEGAANASTAGDAAHVGTAGHAQ